MQCHTDNSLCTLYIKLIRSESTSYNLAMHNGFLYIHILDLFTRKVFFLSGLCHLIYNSHITSLSQPIWVFPVNYVTAKGCCNYLTTHIINHLTLKTFSCDIHICVAHISDKFHCLFIPHSINQHQKSPVIPANLPYKVLLTCPCKYSVTPLLILYWINPLHTNYGLALVNSLFWICQHSFIVSPTSQTFGSSGCQYSAEYYFGSLTCLELGILGIGV